MASQPSRKAVWQRLIETSSIPKSFETQDLLVLSGLSQNELRDLFGALEDVGMDLISFGAIYSMWILSQVKDMPAWEKKFRGELAERLGL